MYHQHAVLSRAPFFAGLLLVLLVTGPGLVAEAGPVIREGDTWRYFRGLSSNPPDQNGSWTQIGYNDSFNWSAPSASGFGYGDCDDATEIANMINQHVSLFIRRAFVITNTAQVTSLSLAVDYDDGFVAYINGSEVARANMPGGTVQYNTLASGNHESSRGNGAGPPMEKEFFTLNPSVLVTGTNVLAVSGHNVSLGSSDFSLVVELYTNVSIVRGPFIQMPEEDQVTVVWRTAALADSVVEYGLDTSYSTGAVSNGVPTRDHTISIPGLIRGTSYYYRVRGNGEILDAGNTFRTKAATNQSFRFAVIGDFGQGTAWMSNVADRVNARTDFDLLLTVGDNVYGTIPCSLEGAPGWYDPYFFKLYEPTMKRVATFPCMGNHDADTAAGQWMVDYFRAPTNGPAGEIGKNYSFDFGNVHFVVINSDPVANGDTAVINATRIWLSNDLAQATAPWKLAFLHHPPYTSEGSHGDNIPVQQNIVPILQAAGVQMVFQGHNHFYERLNAIGGMYYITSGSGGAWLYTISNRKPYSAALVESEHSYSVVEIDGTSLTVNQYNESDVLIDTFNIDIGHEFAIDGLLDDPAWLRAENGLKLYAAIRRNTLYVATQDAGESSDHFVYVADNNTNALVGANWGKSGSVMQWTAFLADENDGGFQSWFDASQGTLNDAAHYRSMTSGLNNNDPVGNGVLEGTLDLPQLFGNFPAQLYLAAAPFGTTNAGSLISVAQVPAGNGDADLQGSEFLAVNPRDIALDLPLAQAGSDQLVEAGMWAVVDGGGSASLSGFPLAYNWAQVSGPAITTANFNQQTAAFVTTANVASGTSVVLRLLVNDGRFDSDADPVTISLIPMIDSDNDGLSDNEELTGYNNILTAADPAGHLTNPADPDSDGDGMSDGDEALSGTHPGETGSVFKVVSGLPAGATGLMIDWNTVSGRLYRVYRSTELLSPSWFSFSTLTATGPVSRVIDTNPPTGSFLYYRLTVDPAP